ncbi:ABC transporter, ATP-binding protein [Desulfitobacterium hafniense DP7]|uniref:ABC transporter, ATP-binding protein n=1 Tax=Desulfitobacterium hafniense DP7 TaxID=537010 RepID=G9XIG2_DESHA|nr:ATP-binding cassette domain-containing protein [Desulfitobacterium hafniense]EHL08645.1 ABC transporter, ATP-binding protein [Desulfitobacterium hafniense DP7]
MLLEVNNVSFGYSKKDLILKNVSFSVDKGERVGLVGPSGYGKSTLAKLLAGYLAPTEGEILFEGKPLPTTGYCPVQLIYQHPEKAVNFRWRMRQILEESWVPDEAFLQKIGIEKQWLNRWPNELSGGELQRFCIARILGPQTKFLLADEISTMLDVITQAQIWQLVLSVVEEREMGMIVVTHSEALAQKACTRIIDLPALNAVQP